MFCVYPWVGLLRSGIVDQALHVLDRCRVRWGRIESVSDGSYLVSSEPLVWDGGALRLGPRRTESVTAAPDPNLHLAVGDDVALHWDYACHVLTAPRLHQLRRDQMRHIDLANRNAGRIDTLLG